MFFKETTLQAILLNKEERVKRQNELLSRFEHTSLISISVNMPGSIKLCVESLVVFEEAIEALEHENVTMLHTFKTIKPTGPEALFVIQEDALVLKKLTCKIETTHPLGRFMDIDVLDSKGNILSRKAFGESRRKCFVCEDDAFSCARSQKHPMNELQKAINRSVQEHAFGKYIATFSALAMQKEVELTPKPGLVDSANSGAHNDMDIHTFYASIEAIKPYVEQFVHYAHKNSNASFEELRQIGLLCENAMFDATQGVNTHKGMIFCLALVGGAVGVLKRENKILTCKALQEQIQLLCPNLIDEDLIHKNPHTAGARFFYETGSLGIRGEAQSGFATIFEKSLPFFQEQKVLCGEDTALKKTLLLLMSILDDSTLWSRGGMLALTQVKEKSAQMFLHVNNDSLDKALKEFDDDLICLHLSPGGSADLLAITWLIAHILEN